jgi:hypothetical protein
MESKHYIPVKKICTHYNLELSFIDSLQDMGLIRVRKVKETKCLYEEEIHTIEKMMRLHYELDINLEGIEAIAHLLQRVDRLQEELTSLKNRLSLYEDQ